MPPSVVCNIHKLTFLAAKDARNQLFAPRDRQRKSSMGRAKGKGRKENKKPFIAHVKDRNERHISVKVSLETKVGEMKRRIAVAEPTLRADRIMLFSPGHNLDDDEKTLADYEGITKDSPFSLLISVHVIVDVFKYGNFDLQTTSHETVKHTKNEIERRAAIDLPAASMVLVHNGVAVLRNDDRLAEKGVKDGSVLVCLVRRPEQAQHEARRWWKMARRLCDFCGKQGRISKPTFPRCSLCSKRRYCDENCQRADWEARHSRFCEGTPEYQRILADAGFPGLRPDPDLDEVPDQFGPW